MIIIQMCPLTKFLINTLSRLIILELRHHQNPSARTRPQDLHVTHNDCEETQQKHYINTQLIK